MFQKLLSIWCPLAYCALMRVPWTARKSNQSILKEINPERSLEGLMLKLKLQHLGYLMQRANSLERPWCWERLKAEGEGDDRGWDGWMASMTQWTSLSKLRQMVKDREAWCATAHGVAKSWTWLSDWTNYLREMQLWVRNWEISIQLDAYLEVFASLDESGFYLFN